MKVRLLCILSLAVVLTMLLFLPSNPVVTAQGETGAQKQVSYRGISFSFDESLANSVLPMSVAEPVAGRYETNWLFSYPEHVEFDFDGYPSPQRAYAVIYVFPVQEIRRLADRHWLYALDTLVDILSQKPAFLKPSWRAGEGSAREQPPVLPPVNAARFFVGQQRYMKFDGGEGVRFLVHGAQEVRPITGEDTHYTFHGLTSDGKYYVAAHFATFLRYGLFPEPVPSDDPGWVGDYNRQMVERLDKAQGSDFFPNLDTLDSMMRSLTIDSAMLTASSPSAVPDMPRTGASSRPGGQIFLLAAVVASLVTLGGLVLRRTARKL